MRKTIKILLVLASTLLLADQVVLMTDVLAPALWSVFGSPLSILIFGWAMLFLAVDLLRGRVCLDPGGFLSAARVLLLAGGGITLVIQLAQIFGVQPSFTVTNYILPASLILLCLGISVLAFGMRFTSKQAS